MDVSNSNIFLKPFLSLKVYFAEIKERKKGTELFSDTLNVLVSANLNAPAEAVWGVIGDFNGLDNWHPGVKKSTLREDRFCTIRKLDLLGGGFMIEKCLSIDKNAYTYETQKSPLPVSNCLSTIRIIPGRFERCTVKWVGDFKTAGVSDREARDAIAGIYQMGLISLIEKFGD